MAQRSLDGGIMRHPAVMRAKKWRKKILEKVDEIQIVTK